MAKKQKRKVTSESIEDKKSNSGNDIENMYDKKRREICESPLHFKFNKERVKLLNDCNIIPEGKSTILYWMHRDQRVQDNWAMIFAQRLALKYEIPMMVCFCLQESYMKFSKRHFDFMLKGLEIVNNDLFKLDIPFVMLLGDPVENITKFVKNNNISAVVCDFLPLEPHKTWLIELKEKLPKDVSFSTVDAHNIVPVWVTSDKREYAAKTIRPKIHKHLENFLTEFPPVISHPYKNKSEFKNDFNIEKYIKYISEAPNVEPIKWAIPGYHQGLIELESFIKERLPKFADTRNDATHELTSNLSPWFRFGHLSVQRTILRAMDFKDKYKHHVEIFIEETVVRRELSENYCYFTDNPESYESGPSWALKSLKKHEKDKRSYEYSLEELENSKTHDDVWNAAQNQLRVRGKMSNYLRMYWGKKMLEWTKSPKDALKYAIYLNDKYSIDGNDCNGIVGCMWCMCGLHDRPWTERPIFGMIRYMNETGCKRHFDVQGYLNKYGHVKSTKTD